MYLVALATRHKFPTITSSYLKKKKKKKVTSNYYINTFVNINFMSRKYESIHDTLFDERKLNC